MRKTSVSVILTVALLLIVGHERTVKAQPGQEPAKQGDVKPEQDTKAKTDLQIAKLTEAIDSLSEKVEQAPSAGPGLRDITAIISATIGLLGVIFGFFLSLYTIAKNTENTTRALQQRANEEEAKAIHKKLDEFYGPFAQLRGTSKLLYQIFRSRQPDPENFRTLIALLDGKTFEGIDRALLDEIIKIGEETEKLIIEKAGLIDEELQDIIWKVGAHYRVIRLASAGAIEGGGEEFHGYVFPRHIDEIIAEKIRKLRQRLTALRTVG